MIFLLTQHLHKKSISLQNMQIVRVKKQLID